MAKKMGRPRNLAPKLVRRPVSITLNEPEREAIRKASERDGKAFCSWIRDAALTQAGRGAK